jgi:hypothetical protein
VSDENQVRVDITASTGNLDQGMQHAAETVRTGAEGMRNGLNPAAAGVDGLAAKFKSFLTGLQASMSGATAATGTNTTNIAGHFQTLQGRVGGAVSGLQGQLGGLSNAVGFVSNKFAALAAIAAGVGVFKEGIAFSKQFTGEAMGLSKALNISATEAATLNVALGDIYSSSETVIEGTQHLSRQLRNNEEALNKMGLKTRDANGEYRNMRDLLLDGVKVMGGYKEGTDRALAGQVLFGKGAAEVGSLLKLNNKVLEDAADKQKELGLTVTEQNVTAMKEYKAAMNDVGDVMDALKKTIGDAVMPIFTQFGQWLSSAGPAAVFVLKGAVDGLAATFWFVRNGVIILWETIKAGLFTLTEPVRAFGAALYKAFTGDFAGAKAEIANIGTEIASSWGKAMDNMAESSELTSKRVGELFLEGTATTKTDNSKKKSFVDPVDNKPKAKDDRMKMWEAQLLADKTAYMMQNEMREMSVQDEADYWRKILSTLKAGDTQINAVKKQIAAAEFADAKRVAQQRMDLQQEVIDFDQKMALGRVDAEQEADAQRLALGQETDARAIQMEQAFEMERYNIQRKALERRLELLSKDPSVNLVERQKILDQLLEMEQKHANDSLKIQNKSILQEKQPYLNLSQSIGQSFKQNLSSMLQGTTTFAGALRGLFKGIMGAFADMVADMAAKWLMTQITNRIVQASTGVAAVMSNAAVAASAAFASTAAIPYVGLALAPEAAATAYAATAAFAPLASARGGYDIPAGVNPVTQLHEKEMVLPAKQADAVRQMAEGGGGGGAIHLHVHAVDAKSVQRLFKDSGRALGSALQNQVRNFALKG